MVTLTYLPFYLCNSSDSFDSFDRCDSFGSCDSSDSCDISDSSDSSDSRDISEKTNSGKKKFFFIYLFLVTTLQNQIVTIPKNSNGDKTQKLKL